MDAGQTRDHAARRIEVRRRITAPVLPVAGKRPERLETLGHVEERTAAMRITMKNGIRAMLIAALTLTVPGLYATHPIRADEKDSDRAPADPDGGLHPLSELVRFELNAESSRINLSTFFGSESVPLAGEIELVLNDPRIGIPEIAGNIGVSVYAAGFYEVEAAAAQNDTGQSPREWTLDRDRLSEGVFNTIDHSISIRLYLTMPQGELGRWPIELSGSLEDGRLSVAGENGIPDANVALEIDAWAEHDSNLPYDPNSGGSLELLGPRYIVSEQQSSATFELLTETLQTRVNGSIRFTAVDFAEPVNDTQDAGTAALQEIRVFEAAFEAVELLVHTDPILQRVHMQLDTSMESIGTFDAADNSIEFELWLTGEEGPLPIPMPIHVSGEMSSQHLILYGDSGESPDYTRLRFTIAAAVQTNERDEYRKPTADKDASRPRVYETHVR